MANELILAIESSCDETAAAVVRDGREVLSNIIASQIDLHTLYGGVVPEIASRKHVEKIVPVIEEAMKQAGVRWEDLSAIGVTYGPGLVGALLVGVSAAKAIAYAKHLPLIGVHHIEGHILANYIEHPALQTPFLCEVISGGHTHLVIVHEGGRLEILGRTRDDAAGEAFDKVARAIGLGYPGGPKIEQAAIGGDPQAIAFPRTHIAEAGRGGLTYARGAQETGPYDFSFSGLKSAVLNYVNQQEMAGKSWDQADIAASFQAAVIDDLVDTAMRAADEYKVERFAIAGGVASNGTLRRAMAEACDARGLRFYYPSPIYCTDNAAMIGVAAHEAFRRGERASWDLNAVPNLPLPERM